MRERDPTVRVLFKKIKRKKENGENTCQKKLKS